MTAYSHIDLTTMIDGLRAIWVVLNGVTLVLTVSAFLDARADQRAVHLLNGAARELAATGMVRREVMRLIIQTLLLTAVLIQDLFVPLMMMVPVVLLSASILDARDRRAMTVLVTAEVLAIHNTALDRIEEKLDANTEISQGARDDAHEAVEVANNVNEKIASLDRALLRQGRAIEEAAADGGVVDRIEELAQDTHDKVVDLHEGTAPE